jgi:hypothetical protein
MRLQLPIIGGSRAWPTNRSNCFAVGVRYASPIYRAPTRSRSNASNFNICNVRVEKIRHVDEGTVAVGAVALCKTKRDYCAVITAGTRVPTQIKPDIFRTCRLSDFGNETRRSGTS